MNKSGSVRFDDIEGLRRGITGAFGPWSQEVEVSQELINQFAAVSGDDQWIHVDVERARRESGFGGAIAHGLLVLSLMSKLAIPRPVDITGFTLMLHAGSDRLRFVKPVPAGARLRGRSRLKDVQATERGTRTVAELNIHISGDEGPAVVYDIITVYR